MADHAMIGKQVSDAQPVKLADDWPGFVEEAAKPSAPAIT